MGKEISIAQWQTDFINGYFHDPDIKTQIRAGWYDWFCRDTSLRNKTVKMGNIIKQIRYGGKVDLNNWYVWFKNNCPLNFPLYDDFRFATIDGGNTQMTVQIACGWNKKRYTVYGVDTKGVFQTDIPLFETNKIRELVKWLNEPWSNL